MPKMDFILSKPLLNAAGSLGFAPDPRSGVNFSRFGAFITNPVSAGPRNPAQSERFCATPGGVLLHTGHPNPGFNAVLRQWASRWAHADLPIIVHLLGQHPDDIAIMVRRLEGMEGVMGVELGLPPGIGWAAAQSMVEAAVGELMVIVRIPDDPLGRGEPASLAELAVQAGAGALSLGAPRGLHWGGDPERPKLVEGRLYGPGLLAAALWRVKELSGHGIPVIGAGGIYSEEAVQAMLAAGAAAVQVDTALWRRMAWLF